MSLLFKQIFLFLIFLGSITTRAQSVNELINQVSTNNLNILINEFSGEVTSIVGGNSVTIKNRVSSLGNNLAADYLKQKLNSYGNLNVVKNNYSATGRNIIATQTGTTNPNNVYIISAHYDSVANYSADDNATGTAAVLETARILSNYCIENTIIYALWDEEEEGLIGSKNYAADARLKNKNILGVINLDMIGYDKDQNNNIPIHTKNVANSLVLKDDILTILNTHKTIGLTPTIVNPGIDLSDHASFWNNNYTSIMLSEATTTQDLTPHYHTAEDRVSTLDLEYFYKISRLLVAITATKANLINSNSCSLNVNDFKLNKVKIYPNPAKNLITIRLKSNEQNTLKISSLTNQLIHFEKLNQKETFINISSLAKGIYILKIENKNGFIVKKFIKK
ncbi:M28 family peptidase [Polaribacter gochangensis]|uniref:M28 family peptidase n=1 Tax=Polaribacter gochangensis TaxID=3252903 RepID=UPI0039046B13